MGRGQDSQRRRWALLHLGAALLYGATSVSTTFFNKAVLTVWNFEQATVLLLLQHVVTLALLRLLVLTGLIAPLKQVRKDRVRSMLPMALLYSVNVLVALYALRLINVSIYGVLKRSSVPMALVGEFLVLDRRASARVVASVVLIVGGMVVAGATDLSFDLRGYSLTFLSSASQTGYLLYASRTRSDAGLSTFDVLQYNSLLALPVVGTLTVVSGELFAVREYEHLQEPGFALVLLANLLLGGMLQYSLFLCTLVNSPLTTTVVGQLKSSVSTILGLFVMAGSRSPTLANLAGLALNTTGGAFYAYVRFDEKRLQSSVDADSGAAAGDAPQPDHPDPGGGGSVDRARRRGDAPLLPVKA